MIVYGRVEGKIRVGGLIQIKKDSVVTGEIEAGRISIEDGARFNGSIGTRQTESAELTRSTRVQPPIRHRQN
jgi:cytoskeletal protein CcmA (bactofilin family)